MTPGVSSVVNGQEVPELSDRTRFRVSRSHLPGACRLDVTGCPPTSDRLAVGRKPRLQVLWVDRHRDVLVRDQPLRLPPVGNKGST
jgi:hypothetical protein